MRDFPDDGRQVLPVVPVVAWRGGLEVSVSTRTAPDRGLILGTKVKVLSVHERTYIDYYRKSP